MTFVGFHHVRLAMPRGREADAIKFYCEVLGFDEAPKPSELATRGGCWFRAGPVELHLGVEEPFIPARKAHPAILVEDLDAVRQRLESGGVEVVWDTHLEGHRRFYVSDPFWNRLELIAAIRA